MLLVVCLVGLEWESTAHEGLHINPTSHLQAYPYLSGRVHTKVADDAIRVLLHAAGTTVTLQGWTGSGLSLGNTEPHERGSASVLQKPLNHCPVQMTPTRFLLPRNSRHLGLLKPLPITTAATIRCTVPVTTLNCKFSTTACTSATPLPISTNWHGPPPKPPVPRLTPISEFRARQRKTVVDRAKKFWKEVHVVETSGK
jgi:hypothetical protein